MKIILVLGAPNSAEGELSGIALDRLDHCLKIFDPKDNQIVCTGGFGEHFNTSPKAHAVYAMNYLMENGVENQYFLEHAFSSNTVEDAVKVKEILASHDFDSIVVITSDYHLDRVRLIFDEILECFRKDYIGVQHNMSVVCKNKLVKHEEMAINKIVKGGLYY
jgi:vancomycin permeability regulator SanA